MILESFLVEISEIGWKKGSKSEGLNGRAHKNTYFQRVVFGKIVKNDGPGDHFWGGLKRHVQGGLRDEKKDWKCGWSCIFGVFVKIVNYFFIKFWKFSVFGSKNGQKCDFLVLKVIFGVLRFWPFWGLKMVIFGHFWVVFGPFGRVLKGSWRGLRGSWIRKRAWMGVLK